MDIINEIFGWIVSAGLRASVAVLLVIILRKFLLSRIAPNLAYACWLPVLLVLVCPMVPSLAIIPGGGVDDSVQIGNTDFSQGIAPLLSETVQVSGLEVSDSIQLPALSSIVEPLLDHNKVVAWSTYLGFIWVIGALLFLITIHGSFLVTRYKLSQSSLLKPEGIDARISTLGRQIGLHRSPKVLVSAAVKSPAVFGFWSYTILLNRGFFTQISEEEQDLIILHELTHIKRGDMKLNLLLSSLLALHWFNPILYFAFLLARIDREAACDADVLRGASKQKRVTYGHTLLKLESSSRHNMAYVMSYVGLSSSRHGVRYRIQSIISDQGTNKFMKTITIASISLLALVGVTKSVEPIGTDVKTSVSVENRAEKKHPLLKHFYVEIINESPELYSDDFVLKLNKKFNGRRYLYDKEVYEEVKAGKA